MPRTEVLWNRLLCSAIVCRKVPIGCNKNVSTLHTTPSYAVVWQAETGGAGVLMVLAPNVSQWGQDLPHAVTGAREAMP